VNSKAGESGRVDEARGDCLGVVSLFLVAIKTFAYFTSHS